jgi:hypothetical protein
MTRVITMSMKSMSSDQTPGRAEESGSPRPHGSARLSILNGIIALVGAGFNAVVWGFAIAAVLDGSGAYVAVFVAAVVFVLSLVVFALLTCSALGRPETAGAPPDANAGFQFIAVGDRKRGEPK